MRWFRIIIGVLLCVVWTPVWAQMPMPERMDDVLVKMNDAEPAVRAAAVRSLRNHMPASLPVIYGALFDPAAVVRKTAALTLGILIDAPIDDAPHSGTRRLRMMVRERHNWDPGIYTELAALLDDDDEDVRVAAAIAMVFMDDPRAPALLPVAIRHPDVEIRRRALDAMTGELVEQTPAIYDLLAPRLREETDRQCHDDIVQLLGYVHDPRLAVLYRDLLASPDQKERIIALRGFERLRDDRCGEIALQQLHDPAPDVRTVALEMISRHRPPGAVKAILTMLTDGQEPRGGVIESIGILHARKAVPALVTLLKNPKEQGWHRTILYALQHISTREAIDAIFAYTPATREMRQSYIGVLAQIDDPRIVEPLLTALTDEDEDLRSNAYNGIHNFLHYATPAQFQVVLQAFQDNEKCIVLECLHGDWPNPPHVEFMLLALRDPDEQVRAKAVDLLRDVTDPRVPNVLRDLLTNDPSRAVRVATARVLAAQPTTPIADIQLLARHEQPEIRYAAINELDPKREANIPLLLAAARDADETIRIIAITKLQGIRHPDVPKILSDALREQNPDLRRVALHVLAERTDIRRDTRIEDALLHIMQAEDQPDIRAAAVRQLEGTDTPQILDALAAMLTAKEDELRLAAAVSLGRTGDRRALPALREYMKKPIKLTELQSVRVDDEHFTPPTRSAYGGQGSENVAISVLKYYRDSSLLLDPLTADATMDDIMALTQNEFTRYGVNARYVRQLANTLLEMGEPAVMPILALLQDKTSRLRALGTVLWMRRKDARAVLPLMALLRDLDAAIRRLAARALQKQDDPRAVEGLIKTLADDDAGVRATAALALGHLGDTRAVPALLPLLTDADINPQFAAAWALSALPGPAALEPLLAALPHARDGGVRFMLVYALSRLRDPRVADALWTAAHDEIGEIQAVAISGLTDLKDPRLPAFLLAHPEANHDIFEYEWLKRISHVAPDIEAEVEIGGSGQHYFYMAPDRRLITAYPDPALIAPLCALIEDVDDVPNINLVRMLYPFTDPRAVNAVVAYLGAESLGERDSMNVMQMAEDAAAGNIRPALAAQMTTWLKDPQPRLRRIALAFFRGIARGKMTMQTPIPDVLYALVTDGDVHVRLEVVSTLQAIGDTKATAMLKAMQHDANANIRTAAGEALRTDRDAHQLFQ